MARVYVEDKNFQGTDFSKDVIAIGDYDNCSFVNCNFAKADLSEINFDTCQFNSCDFSLVAIKNVAFRDIAFKDCKLLGLHFDDCNKFVFSVRFENCQLNLSSFFKMNLIHAKFKDCNLQEVDFSESNLTGIVFNNCNLTGTIFDNTIIEKADFRSAINYSIDPEKCRIKKAKFSIHGIRGLLDKYNIVIE